MPQHSGRVLVDADVSGHIDSVILYHRSSRASPLLRKGFPQLDKAGKAPVAFFRGESVVCSWSVSAQCQRDACQSADNALLWHI